VVERKLRERIEFAGGPVEYRDISGKSREADGTFSKEVMHGFLHLAPKGYDIWAEAIGNKGDQVSGSRVKGAIHPAGLRIHLCQALAFARFRRFRCYHFPL
jgi:hypothetical protein